MTVVTDEGMALVDQIRQKKRPAPLSGGIL